MDFDTYGFIILMLIFGAAILITALILSSGNYRLLPKRLRRAKYSDTKAYTKGLAKVLAIVAFSPILCGLSGIIFKNNTIAFAVLIISFIVLLIMGSRTMQPFYDEDAELEFDEEDRENIERIKERDYE